MTGCLGAPCVRPHKTASAGRGANMSDRLTVESREVPILLDCDVLVVGAGMSGFAAAISAARAGSAWSWRNATIFQGESPPVD